MPLVSGLSLLLHQLNISNRTFIVRSKIKDHYDLIEGQFRSGDHVLIIEDVVTSGQTVYKTIQTVEDQGGIVVQVVAVLDRMMGASELLKQYNFTSLLDITDIFNTN